jgi:hypothetical protein
MWRQHGSRENDSVNTGYTTIITPIRPNQTEALRRHLRSEVEPQFDPAAILRCNRFPFDEIQNLHLCSFVILDADPEFPPCLVFEATFDGSRACFFDALLQVASRPMHEIYQHCEQYPVSGVAAPELFKRYLADHDVGAQTFFRGSPGRTVAQIRGEASIYQALVRFVSNRWRSLEPMPATFAGLQEELHRVIRQSPANRWGEQVAAVPWEVAFRGLLAGTVVLASLTIACGIGVLLIGLFGLGISHVYHDGPAYVGQVGSFLFGHSSFQWLNQLSGMLGMTISLPLTGLLLAWGGVRFLQLFFQYEDPRAKFGLRLSVLVLTIIAYAFLAAFIGFALLLLDPMSKLDPSFTAWLNESFNRAHSLRLLLTGLVAFVVFILSQHWTTTQKLAVQFEELDRKGESLRRLAIDVLRLCKILAVVSVLFVISRYLPDRVNSFLVGILFPLLKVSLLLAAYTFVGVLIVGFALFLVARIKEYADRTRFASAGELITVDNSCAYAREEGGTNTYQNHLASLTYVKPGFVRLWMLKLTLFFIGLLSRFWFNVGDLGGIPTILSARWVMIDAGKRLLFLDHYGGAWDSYLNEFIDMHAVTGLNAIWTNTFIKASGKKYGFPETEYYFWKGAQTERPFKAYVRQSQIKTIVWYSAYPMPATININTRTNLRQSLFKSLTSCEVDALLQNL